LFNFLVYLFKQDKLKEKINIVWFKRDLRFTDHESLYLAQQSQFPTLFIYFFEPSLIDYDDSDVRHWRFIHESLQEMNEKLKSINGKIFIFHTEVLPIFDLISQKYDIDTLYSHQEIGNKISYDRDIQISIFCKNKSIVWKESQTNGIIRKLKSRTDWEKRWKSRMLSNPKIIDETNWNSIIQTKVLPYQVT